MTLPHYPRDHAQGRASKGTKVDSRSRSSVPFRHPSLIHHICFSTAAPCQRHVHRSGTNRAPNREQPRSVKKGSAAAPVGVRRAHCDQGDRCVPAIRVPSLWGTSHEGRAKDERMHYVRSKSSTDRKLGAMSRLGRVREFSLELLWRILARRQRRAGREGRLEGEQQRKRRATRPLKHRDPGFDDRPKSVFPDRSQLHSNSVTVRRHSILP